MTDQRPLRTRRLEAGLTQAQLAELLGVDPRTVGRWENDERRPPPAARARIEQALAGRTMR